MDKIAFHSITKSYNGTSKPAVDSVSFGVPEGSTCMLVGTSGSGKTTLLRMVNRLIEPTSGEILIDGKNVLTENPVVLRRRIGYVIQQVGLFPHLNIAENVRVTAEIAGGWSKQKLNSRVDELLDLVGLAPSEYRARFPRQLSGGQQQRVGLARALATDPAILLMDEPFGALDAITRERMQNELLRIQRDVHKTILFVSHDMAEAFKLGNQNCCYGPGPIAPKWANLLICCSVLRMILCVNLRVRTIFCANCNTYLLSMLLIVSLKLSLLHIGMKYQHALPMLPCLTPC